MLTVVRERPTLYFEPAESYRGFTLTTWRHGDGLWRCRWERGELSQSVAGATKGRVVEAAKWQVDLAIMVLG